MGDIFNAGDYEVTVTELTSGSQALGWTGTGMVDQNLIAGVKIPMSVVFENIKINSCYQYYNRGENGAVVRTRFDESMGGVVGINSNDLGKNHAQEIISRFTSIVDILGIFECSTSQKSELVRLLGELEILSSQAQGNLDYSDAQKALLKEGVLEVKTLVNGLLSCCVASSPNGRVAAGTCEPTSTIQAKTQTRISELQNFPKPSFSPYVIAQTRRRPGKADNLVDIADDLKHGDFTKLDELISVNDNFRRLLVSPYLFDKNYNDPNVLKQEWINLNNQATMNDIEMRNVANLMTEKVFSGNGGLSYSFSVLNQRADVCGSTNNLIENIKTSWFSDNSCGKWIWIRNLLPSYY